MGVLGRGTTPSGVFFFGGSPRPHGRLCGRAGRSDTQAGERGTTRLRGRCPSARPRAWWPCCCSTQPLCGHAPCAAAAHVGATRRQHSTTGRRRRTRSKLGTEKRAWTLRAAGRCPRTAPRAVWVARQRVSEQEHVCESWYEKKACLNSIKIYKTVWHCWCEIKSCRGGIQPPFLQPWLPGCS